MKALVSFLAKALVDNPELVQVEEHEKDDVIVEVLRVAKDDLGKVIGKQGSTAKAIRTLLASAALNREKKCKLEIIE